MRSSSDREILGYPGMNFTADIRAEGGSYWAVVRELPGCFASGDTLDEPIESLREAIQMHRGSDDGGLRVVAAVLESEPVGAMAGVAGSARSGPRQAEPDAGFHTKAPPPPPPPPPGLGISETPRSRSAPRVHRPRITRGPAVS